MDNENIKKKIFALRKAQGLSWADLAAKCGQKDYRNILNALNSPGLSLSTLGKLANALNIEPWELLKPDDITQEDTQHDTQQIGTSFKCPACGAILKVTDNKSEENETLF